MFTCRVVFSKKRSGGLGSNKAKQSKAKRMRRKSRRELHRHRTFPERREAEIQQVLSTATATGQHAAHPLSR